MCASGWYILLSTIIIVVVAAPCRPPIPERVLHSSTPYLYCVLYSIIIIVVYCADDCVYGLCANAFIIWQIYCEASTTLQFTVNIIYTHNMHGWYVFGNRANKICPMISYSQVNHVHPIHSLSIMLFLLCLLCCCTYRVHTHVGVCVCV